MAVVELVEDVARLAGDGEARQALAPAAEPPRGNRHREGGRLLLQLVDLDAAPG
jgi:hypothetical protein